MAVPPAFSRQRAVRPLRKLRIISVRCGTPVDHIHTQCDGLFTGRRVRCAQRQQHCAGGRRGIVRTDEPERVVRHQCQENALSCAAPQSVQQHTAEFFARTERAGERRFERRRGKRQDPLQNDHLVSILWPQR